MAFEWKVVQEIGSANKNSRMKILVRLVKVNGSDQCDIRLHMIGVADEDKLTPTRKGLCLSAATLAELLPMFEQARQELLKLNPDKGSTTDAA